MAVTAPPPGGGDQRHMRDRCARTRIGEARRPRGTVLSALSPISSLRFGWACSAGCVERPATVALQSPLLTRDCMVAPINQSCGSVIAWAGHRMRSGCTAHGNARPRGARCRGIEVREVMSETKPRSPCGSGRGGWRPARPESLECRTDGNGNLQSLDRDSGLGTPTSRRVSPRLPGPRGLHRRAPAGRSTRPSTRS